MLALLAAILLLAGLGLLSWLRHRNNAPPTPPRPKQPAGVGP
jgi:uncharacterized iron-regulated membrane protein